MRGNRPDFVNVESHTVLWDHWFLKGNDSVWPQLPMGGCGIITIIRALTIGMLLVLGTTIPAEAVSRSIGVEAIGFERTVQVNAPESSLVVDFPVPRMAKIRTATATVSVMPGPQLNDETLFFFYYNDKLVSARTAKEIRQQKNFSLQLPVDGVARDFARLQIKSRMFMTDDLCRDYHSGGLFFTVYGDTSLHLVYDMPTVRTVEDFLGSFQQELLVVVPDDATMAEFVPGAWVYGFLKKSQPHMNIRLVRAAELPRLPPVPRIWVGLDSKLPKYFKDSAPGVFLTDSNTLLVSAPDVPGLKTFVQQLWDLSKGSQNPKGNKRIEISPIETPSGRVSEAVAFGNTAVQEGIFSVLTEFSLFPVLLNTIPQRLGIHLEGSHSLPVDTTRPVRMDVFLNSHLVHSSVLDRSGQFKRDIVIQGPLELRALNTLKVRFDYPEDSGQCKGRGDFLSAHILPTSYMWGEGQSRVERFDWSNIGLFLGRQGTVLLDEGLGTNTLKIAGELVYFLNRQLPPGMVDFPELLPLQQQAKVPGTGLLMIAGITGNIPPALQEQMPALIDSDFNLYRKATKTKLFEHQTNANTVVGRVGASKGAPLIIFSADKDGGLLAEALQYLSRPKNTGVPGGNVLVYQHPARLYSFDVRDKDGIKTKQDEKEATVAGIWENNKTWILIAAGVLILLIYLLRRMFPARRKKKEARSRDSSPNELFK